MKLYTCPKDCCGSFGEMLSRLQTLGVEPTIYDDDPEEIFFEFGSDDLDLTEERSLNLKLFNDWFDPSRRPCVICYGRGYGFAQMEICKKCGEHMVVCGHCVEKNREPLAACSFCKTITQNDKERMGFEEMIPQLLMTCKRGMKFDRLVKGMERLYGYVDKTELLTTLRCLVERGVIKRGNGTRYSVN